MTASFTFVKTRIFRRPWNISSFTSDHLEVVRESFFSYFHVETFKLMGLLLCLVIVVYPFFFFPSPFVFKWAFYLFYYGAFMEEVLQSGTSSGFGWQGLIQLSMCSHMKEIFQTFVQALPASTLSVWGDSHLIPALRVRDPNVGSTLLTATKTLPEKHLIIKWNLQLPASVRSLQSLQGTEWCALYARYKPVSKELICI